MSEERELKKNRAGAAAVLSFVFCGMGHIYIGEIKKGLKIMFYSSLYLFILIIGASIIIYQVMLDVPNPPLLIQGIVVATLGLIANAVTSIYNIYDAYKSAIK
jgi:TM2 domain-containing membrane protein YozV